ncbi:tRNA 2-thiouridine(34) synthase MnmA [Candidatus Pacearchaeota archaeon]|nr:tRNA 2-thiouridine(34) synthase MnmA [Candidatus Pacearchaeota archaeon]
MKNKKVILGMSGGVDSSVAALLLQKQGYEVVGVFMKAGAGRKFGWESSINWNEDERILKKICRKLGVKLIVKDVEEGYEKKIIQPMFSDYARGLTPNPDTLCNTLGKFVLFWKIASEIGADWIATGHYARIKRTKNGIELLRGKDKTKDQSYFLCGLTQKDLSHSLFPIGDYTKEEVRKIARRAGFPNWDKHGSRGVCYLGKIDMKRLLRRRIPEKRGVVLNSSGEIVGTHPGQMFFTIGERVKDKDGFEIARGKFGWAGKKLYIAEKLAGNKIVVAEEGDSLLRKRFVFVKKMHWINDEVKNKLKARVRHLGELYSGKLKKERRRWIFIFDKGVFGLAEGQYIVLYSGEKLVGGGEIRLR